MRNLLAYSKGVAVEEKLTLRIKADGSGDIYLPTAGYSSDGVQGCSYDWSVSIDGKTATKYSGFGNSTGKVRVGYGLTPLSVHTVTVKPQYDEYGWLKAFGYKGTDIAGSLINIISDKSYKGYANSEVSSGNYFKAYQYYGCINLINTDEELLPDTLEVIGDYYRYYEYDGCTSLKSNADEKILKTVKVIGNYYRAYQYQNCTNISRINMRAINWAGVGSNYRLNQYSGTGNDREPMDIYIEGGIEEGGSWGLVNNNVKGVYVYKDLVSDYRTKLSTITSSKIQKNAEWDGNEYEFIEFIALADSSGKIRVPVGGFSTSMSQNCAYDWMISVDGGEAVEYTGTGSATYLSVGSGLTEGSEHRVIIKPKTIGWGWGRAFGYLSTGAQAYIKELIHDSYKCFASSRTSTGAHYKHATFTGCTNLINSYEKLPTSVTTIGAYYMKECYAGCTGLKNAFWEILHSGASVGADYRHHEYTGCTALEKYEGICGYTGTTYPTNYKYEYLAGAGNDMDVYITRYEPLPLTNLVSVSKINYTTGYSLYTATGSEKLNIRGDVFEGTSNGSTNAVILKNGTQITATYSGGPNTTVKMDFDFTVENGDVITINVEQAGYGDGYFSNVVLQKIGNPAGIIDNKVNGIYCRDSDIELYRERNTWTDLGDKFEIYYYSYVVRPAIDINRYTKLVGSRSLTTSGTNSSHDYWYLRGKIAVSKNDKPIKLLINGWRDTTNYYGAYLFEYDLGTPGNLSTTPAKWSRVVDSVREGDGNIPDQLYMMGAYDRGGNIYYVYQYDGSSYDWNGYNFNGEQVSMHSGAGNANNAVQVSKDGRYVFAFYNTYQRFTATNGLPGTTFRGTTISDLNGSVVFSDDGLTMYLSEDSTLIKQYTLSKPRDTSTAVDTGKSLALQGGFDISGDGKWLVRLYNGVIYWYTYE